MSSVIEWINVVAICMLAVTLIFPSQYQIPFFYIYAATTALDFFYNKRSPAVYSDDTVLSVYLDLASF